MTQTLIAMRGYPGSGKTTRARQYITDGEADVRVNRDDLRHMTYGTYWGPPIDEDVITKLEEDLVRRHLEDGRSVVVDNTHLQTKYLNRWRNLAALHGVHFFVHNMRIGSDQCVEQDLDRAERGERAVGEKAIRGLAKRYPEAGWEEVDALDITVEPYIPPECKPEAVIFDIDGTLAHTTTRNPYDYSSGAVLTDDVDLDVATLVDWLETGFEGDTRGRPKIILMSGRDDTCRADTMRWLDRYKVSYDELFMRPVGMKLGTGKAPDWIVKLHLFNEHVRDNYAVRFVVDDRRQVVTLWRRLGLKTLQCAPGDF